MELGGRGAAGKTKVPPRPVVRGSLIRSQEAKTPNTTKTRKLDRKPGNHETNEQITKQTNEPRRRPRGPAECAASCSVIIAIYLVPLPYCYSMLASFLCLSGLLMFIIPVRFFLYVI